MKKQLIFLVLTFVWLSLVSAAIGEEIGSLNTNHDVYPDMSIEEKYKYSGEPFLGLPADDDIPEKDALEYAKQALLLEYELTREEVDAYEIYPYYYVMDMTFEEPSDGKEVTVTAPFYYFIFHRTIFEETAMILKNDFSVHVEPKTGDILYLRDKREVPPLVFPYSD